MTTFANYKKQPSHRRDNSGELDVFEAARYFSGYNDNFTLIADQNTRDHQQRDAVCLRGGIRRISLDMPSLKKSHHQHNHHHQHHHHQPPQQPPQQTQTQIKDKKYKQPRSPGGKLAHFLNSLFNQTISSKKKKPSKTSTQSLKDEEDSSSPSGRRKRRSSISHFRSTSNTLTDTKSSNGFPTPPHHHNNNNNNNNNLNTPIKSLKDFTSFTDHSTNVLATLSNNKHTTINGNGGGRRCNEKVRLSNSEWVEEYNKHKNGVVEKPKKNIIGKKHEYQEKKKKEMMKKVISEGMDDNNNDGCESDSSSDLFELQIDYGFGFCSSGLPVYETTNMDSIKRSTAITNGPIKN